jgi:peptidoglycan/LPS O-acetylase OafA/YrhL
MAGKRPEYLRQNNLDLVRLAAASQVALYHSWIHFGLPNNPLIGALSTLPGVPAFFFVSGFLISASYEQNPNLWDYTRNRILRIFPALWGALAFALATSLVFVRPPGILSLLKFIAAQATILQDYHPQYLRAYGVGVLNGSLWTIPVELSFYIGVPLLYGLAKRIGHLDAIIIAACAIFFAILYAGMGAYPADSPIYKLYYVLPVTWAGMFLTGVLAQRHFEHIRRFVEGKFLFYVVIYVVLIQLSRVIHVPALLTFTGNEAGLLTFAGIVGLVLSAAYTKPALASKLLRHNDFSYAAYLYHMPIVNFVIACDVAFAWRLPLTLIATAAVAATSWFVLEERALRLRRHPMLERPNWGSGARTTPKSTSHGDNAPVPLLEPMSFCEQPAAEDSENRRS